MRFALYDESFENVNKNAAKLNPGAVSRHACHMLGWRVPGNAKKWIGVPGNHPLRLAEDHAKRPSWGAILPIFPPFAARRFPANVKKGNFSYFGPLPIVNKGNSLIKLIGGASHDWLVAAFWRCAIFGSMRTAMRNPRVARPIPQMQITSVKYESILRPNPFAGRAGKGRGGACFQPAPLRDIIVYFATSQTDSLTNGRTGPMAAPRVSFFDWGTSAWTRKKKSFASGNGSRRF